MIRKIIHKAQIVERKVRFAMLNVKV